MITFDEALAIVVAEARPLDVETVPLERARGRILAAPVEAMVDSPPADVSAMDGYAMRDADLALARPFRVIGTSWPGTPFAGIVGAGESVRIFTGARVPAEADRVVMQENVRRDGDVMTIETAPGAAHHIRRRGGDFRVGDQLVESGRQLDPRALVAAAGADLAEVRVWRRPRLSVLGTGDELVAPGAARDHPDHIPESVSFGVAAFAEDRGADVTGRHRFRDDIALLEAGAASALRESDIVVVTGGASVGEKDYARQVFAALGADILFSKVAIKPGKPVWLARAGDRLILGLPGNPGSAMVTARLFLAPLLAGMSGHDPLEANCWRRMPLAAPLPTTGDRETFARACLREQGVLPLANQDSGAQLALASADLLIRCRPNAPALPAGATVEVLDF